MPGDRVPRDAAGDLAALGPFCAVHAHPPAAGPSPPWRPLAELTGVPGPLTARIAAVRAVLAGRAGRPAGQVGLRVAASVAHLGLVARLAAPAIAAQATGHRLDLRLSGLWWQDVLGGPVPLSVPDPGQPPGGPGAGVVPADVIGQAAAPLTAAVRELVPVSSRVLWGNVASAVNSAAAQVAARRPDLSAPAWAAARALWDTPWLRRERQPPGPGFRRSSCCLIYQLAPGRAEGVCGDCVLSRPAG